MSKAAKRPEPRTIEVQGEGEFADWQATARADFPAKHLAALQSGDLDRIIGVLDAIVIDHNMPDEAGEIAATMGDVDPFSGLMHIAEAIFTAIGTLPNR
jgi:hypothetical protein